MNPRGKPLKFCASNLGTLLLPFPRAGKRARPPGAYLCLSARIPEPNGVVAHSSGRNPNWWSEDFVTWNIRVQDTVIRRHLNLSLTVNPLERLGRIAELSAGAYSQRAMQPSELSWIPKNAWTEEQRNRLQVTRMLASSLRARMAVIADDERGAWQKVDSREAWERFRDPRLAALRRWLGPCSVYAIGRPCCAVP